MAEERPHPLEVVMLRVHFHRDTVTEVVRLELRAANQPAIGLAETPDVLAVPSAYAPALAWPPPARPEKGCVGRERAVFLRNHLIGVLLEVLR